MSEIMSIFGINNIKPCIIKTIDKQSSHEKFIEFCEMLCHMLNGSEILKLLRDKLLNDPHEIYVLLNKLYECDDILIQDVYIMQNRLNKINIELAKINDTIEKFSDYDSKIYVINSLHPINTTKKIASHSLNYYKYQLKNVNDKKLENDLNNIIHNYDDMLNHFMELFNAPQNMNELCINNHLLDSTKYLLMNCITQNVWMIVYKLYAYLYNLSCNYQNIFFECNMHYLKNKQFVCNCLLEHHFMKYDNNSLFCDKMNKFDLMSDHIESLKAPYMCGIIVDDSSLLYLICV